MIISMTAVKNRISILVLAFIILVSGIYSYKKLPRESEPDITIPYVFVRTDYRGVSAMDVESGITIKIEKKLKGLDRVKNISSVSAQGVSHINIEFLPGTDIDEVLPKVKDKVDEAKNDLPSDLENDPSVFEVNLSEMPVVIYSLAGTCGPKVLKEIADRLKDDIEAVTGVLKAEVTGGQDREIRIEINPHKLAYYQIPIQSIQTAIAAENRNTSGGAITLGNGRYQLKVPGEFDTPDEISRIVVATHQGYPIYLKDVAIVVDGLKEQTSRSRLNGKDAVSISVKKRVGENAIFISDRIDTIVNKAKTRFPTNTSIVKLMDKSRDIRRDVADLENNIISGLILVVVVLFFALGFRNALLVGVAIPFSMFLSFIVLHLLGITLNMIVLFSLTLALGMLVDNAIVIIENIYRYMQSGVPKITAAVTATGEVAWPVIGSTLTTLAAFFPMIFWPGIMGEFMKYLPITLIVTLSSSLFVALVITPCLCAFFMKASSEDSKNGSNADTPGQMDEQPIVIQGFLLSVYAGLLKSALKNKITVLIASFSILILLIQFWVYRVGIETPLEFFPAIDPGSIYVNIEPPEGADMEFIDRTIKQVEKAIVGAPDIDYEEAMKLKPHQTADGEFFPAPGNINNIEHLFTKVVQNSAGSIFESNKPNHIGIQFIEFKERKSPTVDDIEEIRQRVKGIAGVKITVDQQEEGPPTGPPVNIEISGQQFEVLTRIADQFKQAIAHIPHVKDVRDDYQGGQPSIRVSIDRQKAAMFGLTTSTIGNMLKTAYNGLDISTFYDGDDDIDIVLKLPHADRKMVDILRVLMIPAPTGQMVPLTTLVNIQYSSTIGNIIRKNHKRVVTVQANVDESRTTGPLARMEARKILKDIRLPPDYSYKFTGENEMQKESQDFLTKNFFIALLLIFLILVTLFNSVFQPVIILTSIILSLGGAFLGLAVIKSPFGIVMTGVGIISLAGVVVNNAIVLIDYANKLRNNGRSLNDALILSGATRLRPVFLTAVTTILGLLPMVTGISYDFHVMAFSFVSESSQWWRSMAIVVIFGLMVATLLTLVVVPVIYALIETLKGGILKLTASRNLNQNVSHKHF